MAALSILRRVHSGTAVRAVAGYHVSAGSDTELAEREAAGEGHGNARHRDQDESDRQLQSKGQISKSEPMRLI